MIIGNISLRGSADKRKETKDILKGLIGNKQFFDKTGVIIDDVLATFGWSDFNVRVYAVNAEVIKLSVVILRNMLSNVGGDKFLETSTVIGIPITDNCEITNGKEDFLHKYKQYMSRNSEGFVVTPSVSKELKEKIGGYIASLKTDELF